MVALFGHEEVGSEYLILLRELVPLPCWTLYRESRGLLALQIPRYSLLCALPLTIVILYFTLPQYSTVFLIGKAGSITDVRVGICTDSILRDGIKCAVVARAEEIKKVHEVPFLGADGYKSALKYVYEYIRCCENLQEIKTEETFN